MASILRDIFTRAEDAGERAAKEAEKRRSRERKRRDIDRMLPHVGSFGELGMYDNAFWLEEEEQAAGGAAGGRDGGHGDGGGGGVGGGGGGGIARSAPIAAPGFAAAGAHAAGSPEGQSVHDTLAMLRDYEGLRSFVEHSTTGLSDSAHSWFYSASPSGSDSGRSADGGREPRGSVDSSAGSGLSAASGMGGAPLVPPAEMLSSSAPAASWARRHKDEPWGSTFDD